MPRPKLSEAELRERKKLRERMRKAMIKSDPVLREEYLRKDRERVVRRKEAGLIPSRAQMTAKELRIKRQQDRIRSHAYYHRKKAKAIAKEIAELNNDSVTNDVTDLLPENEAPSVTQISSDADEESDYQKPSVSSTQMVPRISRQRQDSSECSYRPRQETPARSHRQREGTPERSLRQRQSNPGRFLRQRQGSPEHRLEKREDAPERLQNYHQKQEEKWDLIGKTIAVQLRDLEKSQRTVAHKLINDVMYYAESGLLNPACAITLGIMNQSVNQSLQSQGNGTVTTLNVYETEDVKDNILVLEDPLVSGDV